MIPGKEELVTASYTDRYTQCSAHRGNGCVTIAVVLQQEAR